MIHFTVTGANRADLEAQAIEIIKEYEGWDIVRVEDVRIAITPVEGRTVTHIAGKSLRNAMTVRRRKDPLGHPYWEAEVAW